MSRMKTQTIDTSELWYKHSKDRDILNIVTGADGQISYQLNGLFHHQYGPARYIKDEGWSWWLNDIRYPLEEWLEHLSEEDRNIALANPDNFK